MTKNYYLTYFIILIYNLSFGQNPPLPPTLEEIKNYEHKNEVYDGFSKKYNTKILVYYEIYDDITEAIKREKQLKKWNRKWKEELIEKMNFEYNDLYEEIL